MPPEQPQTVELLAVERLLLGAFHIRDIDAGAMYPSNAPSAQVSTRHIRSTGIPLVASQPVLEVALTARVKQEV